MTSSTYFDRLRSPALLAASNGRILPSQFLCFTAEKTILCLSLSICVCGGCGLRDVITHLTAPERD